LELVPSIRVATPKSDRRFAMKVLLLGCAAIVLALGGAVPADAKGCLKGALVGGVAGHYAGHHGVLGAAAGCVIGRHEANKRARMERHAPHANNDGGAM
jgi:hypothetical protein